MNRTVRALLVATLLVVGTQAAYAQTSGDGQARNCTNRMLSGAYAVTVQGKQFAPGAPPIEAVAVGVVEFNGEGSLGGSDVASFSGQVVPRTYSGSYTVNSNCTASATLTILTGFPAGATFHFSVVLIDHGRQLVLIQTDPGSMFTGTATKQ